MSNIGRKRPPHFPVKIRNWKAPIVFLTVCTRDRNPILANALVHKHLVETWSLETAWKVGRYVLMPDHAHLFCCPASFDSVPLAKWVKLWKSRSARKWPHPEHTPVWQVDFWDKQLRRSESYEAKWRYVLENPRRHGLVQSSDQWLFQGELNVLPWS